MSILLLWGCATHSENDAPLYEQVEQAAGEVLGYSVEPKIVKTDDVIEQITYEWGSGSAKKSLVILCSWPFVSYPYAALLTQTSLWVGGRQVKSQEIRSASDAWFALDETTRYFIVNQCDPIPFPIPNLTR